MGVQWRLLLGECAILVGFGTECFSTLKESIHESLLVLCDDNIIANDPNFDHQIRQLNSKYESHTF